MSKKMKPAEVKPYVQRYEDFNCTPKLITVAVRWACSKIGQNWREREVKKLGVVSK